MNFELMGKDMEGGGACLSKYTNQFLPGLTGEIHEISQDSWYLYGIPGECKSDILNSFDFCVQVSVI
jgi:hypothetical protein